jgi:hypothetical protein
LVAVQHFARLKGGTMTKTTFVQNVTITRIVTNILSVSTLASLPLKRRMACVLSVPPFDSEHVLPHVIAMVGSQDPVAEDVENAKPAIADTALSSTVHNVMENIMDVSTAPHSIVGQERILTSVALVLMVFLT